MEIGITNEVESTVTINDTAVEMGSGSLQVYATPSMICLMERAASELADRNLPEEQTSVGTLMNVKHISATPVGMKVRATAKLINVDERRLVFEVDAYDEAGAIGNGTHERFIVNRQKFQSKTDSKRQN